MNLKRLARRALATLTLSMLCVVALAQTRQITGTVIDGTGESVIGANVFFSTTSYGVQGVKEVNLVMVERVKEDKDATLYNEYAQFNELAKYMDLLGFIIIKS